MPRKAGKPDYVFQKSYRKANICQKFFYTYANLVVEQVNQNQGTLRMENIEDIKSTELETKQLVHKFNSFIRRKVAATIDQADSSAKPSDEDI